MYRISNYAAQNCQKRKKPCVAFNTQHRAILYSDCIKIYPTLLVAFAVNNTFPLIEIYVGNVKAYQLSYTDSGGTEHINDCHILDLGTVIPHSSMVSSEITSLTTVLVLILWMRRMGLFSM